MVNDAMFLVGIKDKMYLDKEGKQRRIRELHVMYSKNNNDDSFRGNRVDMYYVNFDVSNLEIQRWYEPIWSVNKYQGRAVARLVGLKKVDDAE